LKGTRFGVYEVVRLVGHGATASVFEAIHVGLGKPVALKLLHEHLASDEHVTGRFLREGKVAARLQHPHIVSVLDVGTDRGVPYLVMELLNGNDLRSLLEQVSVLSVEHALGFLVPIASALAHAHDAGVIHRDLKPANIFLAQDEREGVIPKLVDFGLSKALYAEGDGTSALTAAETVAGTLLYMPPEQTLAMKNASPASDQYSWAAIAYEAMTGQPPFTADSVPALLETIRGGAIRPPSTLNANVNVALEGLLLKAMSRDPAARWSSMRALGRELLLHASRAVAHTFERDFADRSSARTSLGAQPPLRTAVAATRPSAATRIEERPSAATRVEERPRVPARSEERPSGATRAAARSEERPSGATRAAARSEERPSGATRAAARSEERPSGATRAAARSEERPSGATRAAARSEERPSGAARTAARIDPLPCAPGASPFHIKGGSYRSFVIFVTRSVGLEKFMAELDDERLRAFIRQPFLASGRYDVLPYRPLFATLARMQGTSMDTLVRTSTIAQVRYDAKTAYRMILDTQNPEDIATRMGRFNLQMYDFGAYAATLPEKNRVVLDFVGIPADLEPWFAPMHVAYAEESLRLAGARDLSVTSHAGRAAGVQAGYPLRAYRTELRWR
jgi:serine/threonine-protein kinase